MLKTMGRLYRDLRACRTVAADRDAAIAALDAALRQRDLAQQERDAAVLVGLPTAKDRELTGDTSMRSPRFFAHRRLWTWLAGVANRPDVRVLEIGSREVASASLWKEHIPHADYTGFDYLAGANVDVVGDAHRLSEYFPDTAFDVVISSAVFEHLAMPWIVAEEIAKILKVGGLAGVETHFAFAEHELPWNFFQFHAEGLKLLFNQRLGFEVLDAGMSNPMVGRFSIDAADYLVGKAIGGLYCHSSILAKKSRQVLDRTSPPFDWRPLSAVIRTESSYPDDTGLSRTAEHGQRGGAMPPAVAER